MSSTDKKNAIRGAVFQYLSKEFPVAAKKMKSEASLSESELNADAAITSSFGKKATFTSVLETEFGARRQRAASTSSSDSDAVVPAKKNLALPKKKSTTPALKPTVAAVKKPVASDSDSDDVPPAKKVPAAVATAKKVSPKLVAAAKKPVASDSDSDDVPPAKKVPAALATVKKVSPKLVAAVKKPVAPDSDSDDVPAAKKSTVAPVVAKKVSPKLAASVKKPVASDSDSDDGLKVKSNAKASAPSTNSYQPKQQEEEQEEASSYQNNTQKFNSGAVIQPKFVHPLLKSQRGMGGAADIDNERFCRIDLANVKYQDERLMNNMPGQDATHFLQNRMMMAVRGKEFNKHKQKNKAKLYGAGVDQTIRSVKFTGWSDDE